MRRKGFTLIELLVVIAIIGLLSTLSVVSLNSARGKARDATRKSDMNAVSTALELYNVEVGSYPENSGCGATPIDNVVAATGVGDNDFCPGNRIVSGSDIILQSIPTPPGSISHEYVGFLTADSYCISAVLESNNPALEDHFKCVNGSCYLDGDPCNDETG